MSAFLSQYRIPPHLLHMSSKQHTDPPRVSLRVEPKSLVRRLTPTATRTLELALGRAVGAQAYEVLVEHFLLAALDRADGEMHTILKQYGQDPGALLSRVRRVLEKQRGGNPARPVLSDALFAWFEDTWLYASLELGDTRLRTGTLLAQLIYRSARYSAETYAELEAIDVDALKRDVPKLLESSSEAAEARPAQSADGTPTAPGADGPATQSEDSALKRFCTNFTERARAGKIDPIFGRHREIRQCVDILARRRKNNPIVVGEPGVGKTALVEGLAIAIAAGEVPETLKNVELLGLDLGLLQAGAGVRGEFENRLKGVLTEAKAATKPVVLFIDEAHTLIGAGGAAGTADAANLLKPALARGELRTIAATTWAEYKKYFEKDAALERRFQPVKVDEPETDVAVGMIRGVRPIFEKAHGVTIRDEAVIAAVELSQRYITGRQLPDKAVDLLDTSAARVALAKARKPGGLEDLELELAATAREIEALERDVAGGYTQLAEKLEASKAKQAATEEKRAALEARWKAERDEALAKEALGAPLGPRGEGLDDRAPLVPLEVDRHVVAEVIAAWTGIPVGRMNTSTLSTILSLETQLQQRVIGQDHAMAVVGEALRMATAGIRNPSTPIATLLFVGPSGVGKTETALALADTIYGGERFMTTINMSEFQEKHSVSRLIGSPPGYVGFGEGGLLTEAVRQRPYSVVLLDEVEKADLEVMNLFYQVFDKGLLSDSEGRLVDFKNTVIILTSNLATDLIAEACEANPDLGTEALVDIIRPALSAHFKPALLARMTIVPYRALGADPLRAIAKLKLGGLAKRLRENQRLKAIIPDAVVDEIVRRSTIGEVGGRNVEHVLRSGLMPPLSRKILEALAAGEKPSRVTLGAEGGEFTIELR